MLLHLGNVTIVLVTCTLTVAHMYTYIHICIHTTYIHTYIHTYNIHTYIHTCIHTYIYTYIHTYIHTCIHTYIHTNASYLLLKGIGSVSCMLQCCRSPSPFHLPSFSLCRDTSVTLVLRPPTTQRTLTSNPSSQTWKGTLSLGSMLPASYRPELNLQGIAETLSALITYPAFVLRLLLLLPPFQFPFVLSLPSYLPSFTISPSFLLFQFWYGCWWSPSYHTNAQRHQGPIEGCRMEVVWVCH